MHTEAIGRIHDGIRDHLADVLAEWEAICRQEPWIHLPADARPAAVEELIRSIIDLALEPSEQASTDARCQRMLHHAAAYGDDRRRRAFPESLLFREVYLMRQSIWQYVRRQHFDPRRPAFEAIARIDTAITLAAKAALRGYFSEAYARQGRWPAALDELVAEWKVEPL